MPWPRSCAGSLTRRNSSCAPPARTTPRLGDLKERVNQTIGAAREKLADLEQEARQRGRRAAAATESWVRSNPWAALAIGAGIGLIVGALIMRSGPAAAAG